MLCSTLLSCAPVSSFRSSHCSRGSCRPSFSSLQICHFLQGLLNLESHCEYRNEEARPLLYVPFCAATLMFGWEKDKPGKKPCFVNPERIKQVEAQGRINWPRFTWKKLINGNISSSSSSDGGCSVACFLTEAILNIAVVDSQKPRKLAEICCRSVVQSVMVH